MKRNVRRDVRRHAAVLAAVAVSILASYLCGNLAAQQLQQAEVTQIVHDVKLLQSGGIRPAAVSDQVREGTGVRTGLDSRAELRFTDLTLTRLGANTVFSFSQGKREVTLESGALLLSVPRDSERVIINTAAVTAAITGGTALFEYHKNIGGKLYVMEGSGEMCSKSSGQCTTVHAGEMATVGPNGQISTPAKFNARLMYTTGLLFTGFDSPLPNADLIELTFIEQEGGLSMAENQNKSLGDTTDTVDQRNSGTPQQNNPPPGGGGGGGNNPAKFGPPSTISSPDPYVINSTTAIQTDPTITTNGAVSLGKIYRGPSQDGSPSSYYFGSTSATDDSIGFNAILGNHAYVPSATFKFSQLQIVGNPSVSVANGGANHLSLIGENGIDVIGGGNTLLQFGNVSSLLLATQNGSINLGSGAAFAHLNTLFFYARGAGSNLTINSPISDVVTLVPLAQGDIDIESEIEVTSFQAHAGHDFLIGDGSLRADRINIDADHDITIDSGQIPGPLSATGISLRLNAANVLNLFIGGGGVFGWDTLDLLGQTINVTGSTTFDFSNSSSVTVTAGSGGIQAPNIAFLGSNLTLNSGADINIGSINKAGSGQDAMVTAITSFNASGDVQALNLSAGTTVTTGGFLVVYDTLAAGGDINVGGFLQATTINAPSSVVTVQSVIAPNLLSPGAALQHTFTVNSIISPNGIDFSGNQFDGINGLSSGGRLTINARTILFNPSGGIAFANFDGADQNFFDGKNPAVGGDGGIFRVNTTGDISAVDGANISATTGANFTFGMTLTSSGAGGTVELHSSGGSVSLDNTILVSSNDGFPKGSGDPYRQSASGGTILVQSDLTTGSGISIGASAQLLSLLANDAPGPGGSITLSTQGADITVNGTIEANRGTITIDQDDPVILTPTITIDGATLVSDSLTINGVGDINIGVDNAPTITARTISITAPGSIQFFYNDQLHANDFTARSTNGGDLTFEFNDALTLNGAARFETTVPSAAMVTSGANIMFTDFENYTNNSQTDYSLFQVTNLGHIGTGGNVTINMAGIIATGPGDLIDSYESGDFAAVVQNTNSQIDTGGNLTLMTGSGSVEVNGFNALVLSYNAQIGTGGNIDVEIGGDLTANHYLEVFLSNRGGGTINSATSVTLNVGGDIIVGPEGTQIDLSSRYDDSGGSTGSSSINGAATLSVHANSLTSTGSYFDSAISNRGGGVINGSANLTWVITNGISLPNITDPNFPASWSILNDIPRDEDTQFTPPGGQTIHGDANVSLNVGGDIDVVGDTTININSARRSFYPTLNGGVIDSDATLDVGATNFSVVGGLDIFIDDSKYGGGTGTAGHIGGDASVTLNLSGNLTGSDYVDVEVDNFNGGSIGGSASVAFSTGSISKTGSVFAIISNSGGGSIGVNATIQFGTTGNVDADLLYAYIDNTDGSIKGDAIINMNVGGTATLASNTTVEIYGNDPSGTAAINFNGGSYISGASAEFRSTIEGSGTITFNNTIAQADIVKVRVMGADGSVIIGGTGTNSLSADTVLRLYAPGSNGLLRFKSDVTLSSGTVMDLAAKKITIDPGFTVTINGDGGMAHIYTDNPDYNFTPGGGYTGPPPNPSNGSFGGNGAHDPESLSSAPDFDDGIVVARRRSRIGENTIQVDDSGQLLSMLHDAKPGSNGVVLKGSAGARHSKNGGHSRVGIAKVNTNPAAAEQSPRERHVVASLRQSQLPQ